MCLIKTRETTLTTLRASVSLNTKLQNCIAVIDDLRPFKAYTNNISNEIS